ncbi:MAG: CHASE2 domain-containing protein [Deltaproteobacteria bacterium]|nr:CHASE2 domain-containing protein [Deltaproteobacteria bacterium]
MKKRLHRFFSVSPFKISLILVIVTILLFLINNPFFYLMELKTLDLRFLSRGARAPGPETVIAEIDEKSLAELGRWPWPRSTIAKLVNTLKEYGAKAVGFDIVFAEPDENSSLLQLAEISKEIETIGTVNPAIRKLIDDKKKEADTDAILAESIKTAGNVTLGYFFHTSRKDIGHLSSSDIEKTARYIADSKFQVIKYLGKPVHGSAVKAFAVVPNIKSLSEAAENAGYFNAFPDIDGTNRWSPLVINYGDNFYPSLSLATLEQYMNWPLMSLVIAEYGIDAVKIGDMEIPTDEAGRILINYLGPAGTFPHYSITDIINGRMEKNLFKDKIVLIGATATAIFDLRVTPFSAVYPGIEIHATVIDNILHQNFIQRPGWTSFIDILAIIFLGLILVPILSRVKAVMGFVIAILLAFIYVFINRFVFNGYNVWLNMVYPIFSIVIVYSGITLYKYVTEEREKKKIRGTFQYYLSGPVIEEMLKDPSKLKLGGEKRDLSVLFSDIRGFTTISEKLTPEDLVHLLNEYLTVMTDLVFKYDGLLDKYMGDAIMAVFGAPVAQSDHPVRCCKTALDMMAELKTLQKKWEDEGKPVLDIGIGINTGDMVVGNMGSKMRFDYTVMGDNVNLGSRLEGINKEYGTNIVISEYTYAKVKDSFFCRELDSVRVKGKMQPVKIYELMGEKKDSEQWDGFVSVFEEGLTHYKQGRWDGAIACFRKVLEIRPGDHTSTVYIERCENLKHNPPEEQWDGVYTMTKK